MGDGDTAVNAVIGAVASVVLSSVVPFAPLFGGGVAGYLQGGTRSDGLRVGTLSGVLAFVPSVLVGFLFLGLLSTVLLGGGVRQMPVLGFGVFSLVGALFLFVFGLVYIVGLSAAGGWLGNYVKYDTDFEV